MTGLDLYTLGFSLMSPAVILAMLAGTVIGIVIGALPGLSATMAVSILLPITYGMSPTAGIMMLLGVYCGGNYGGSIAATLVNIPGTPSAVMTTLDAHPMARSVSRSDLLPRLPPSADSSRSSSLPPCPRSLRRSR